MFRVLEVFQDAIVHTSGECERRHFHTYTVEYIIYLICVYIDIVYEPSVGDGVLTIFVYPQKCLQTV